MEDFCSLPFGFALIYSEKHVLAGLGDTGKADPLCHL